MTEVVRRRKAADPQRFRRGYLDWIRGIAVLIMIEAHVVDSWTAAPDRFTQTFAWAMILGGFGAPLFLLLAGVSVSLSAGSKARRSGDVRGASVAVMGRGLEIFLLAFVFRVQAWILGWSAARTLLRVDILNVMGPSIVLAAALWGAWSAPRARALAFLVATLATALVTPIARLVPWLAPIPDPIEAYFRPAGGFTSFALLPWAGFVFAGALVGVLIDGTRPAAPARAVPPTPASWGEARLNVAFGAGGALLAAAAYAASFLPTPYTRSDFWTTSPAFFFLRLGLLTMAIGLSYAWERRPGGSEKWSPVRQLGRTSLFIYWIHVEMVYGLVSLPLHHALKLRQTWIGLALFSVFMLGCSIGKDRAVAWWQTRRQSVAGPTTARVT
jgi:uncharacterized membrane protein